MNVRHLAAAALVAALAVAAVGATGASGGSTADTLTVWLQVDAQAGWPESSRPRTPQFKNAAPGLGRRRPVPDVGHAPREVRRDARRRERAGRHRDGQHGDDEVHGGGRVPGPDVATRPRSRTRAPGSKASRRPGRYGGKLYGVPYYAGSRVVTYRTDLFRQAGINKLPTSLAEFTAAAKKLGARNKEKALLAGLHRRHRLVRRDELRLRPRRHDRDHDKGKWMGTLDRAEGDRRPDRVQELLRCRVAGQQDDRRDAARTRTTSTRRATRRR